MQLRWSVSCGYSAQLETGLCYILLEAAHKDLHTQPSAIRKMQERTLFSEAAGLSVMLRRWRVAPGRFDQRRLEFLSRRVAQPVGRAARVVQRILRAAQVRRARYMLLHVANRQPRHEGVGNHLPSV
jgi:hypothetical protein